jgi:predicted ATPase
MARLDRLGGPVKELAQIAAAIGREFSHPLLASVVRQPEAELSSALDRLIGAGLLFRRGMPPHATYLFKHALVQDAAYGTLLREPRRTLHARIAETIESEFAESAESRPELLARHWTEAGLIEKAAGLWGKAGQRSLARSALVEAAEQLTRALDQIATLPGTPVVRGEQIKLQVALVNALTHVKGYRRLSPRRPLNGRVNSSSEQKRWENLPKIRCCFSRSSMAPGQQALWRSTETWRAILRRNLWRSQRSKGRPFQS